jgi:hypothetical protein
LSSVPHWVRAGFLMCVLARYAQTPYQLFTTYTIILECLLAARRRREYLKQRPRNLYGEHRYSVEECGLDGSQERNLYAEYLSQFGAYLD